MSNPTQTYDAAPAIVEKTTTLVPITKAEERKDYEPMLRLLYGIREAQRSRAATLQETVEAEKGRLNADRRGIYANAAEQIVTARQRYGKEVRARDEQYVAEIDAQLQKLTFPLESTQTHALEQLFPQEVYARLEAAVRDAEDGKATASSVFVENVIALAKDARITEASLTRAIADYVRSEVAHQETVTAEAVAALDATRKKMDKSARGPMVQLQDDLKEILKERSKAEYAFADSIESIASLRQYGEMGIGHARILLDGYLSATEKKLADGFTSPELVEEGLELGVLQIEGNDAVLKLDFFEEAYKQAIKN